MLISDNVRGVPKRIDECAGQNLLAVVGCKRDVMVRFDRGKKNVAAAAYAPAQNQNIGIHDRTERVRGEQKSVGGFPVKAVGNGVPAFGKRRDLGTGKRFSRYGAIAVF